MEEIEDYDMECEEIKSDEVNLGEANHHECAVQCRPTTPLNISGVSVQYEEHQPGTPPNNISQFDCDLFRTPNNYDSSFIKRAGIDRLLKSRVMPRMTSTPLQDRDRLSNTLPSTLNAPNLAHLRNIRQCKSAEHVRKQRLGPNGIPFKYMNPFTPDGQLFEKKFKAHLKFKRLSLDTSPPPFCLQESSDSESNASHQTSGNKAGSSVEIDLDDIPRRARLKEFNVNRYQAEFLQLQEIGKGVHGCVFKCLNRLNGCLYAIKKTLKPIKSGIQERTVRNEIYAHGILFHPNIVRNFSCWKEDGFVFIQNEFCNGGNLEKYIETNSMSETLLRSLLLQIASGLKYMHKMGLAHMDIKPGNIFLAVENNKESSLESDGGFSDDEKDEITFKLGDLGHVTRLDEDDAEDGDCRYLSREIIEENYSRLDRADIFALGLTVYEAAGGGPLPKNGDEWHDIRNGNLKYLDSHTKEFNDILKRMIDPSAEKRPSAAEVVDMLKPPSLSPLTDDVTTYIHHYQRTNTRLETTALATDQYLKVLFKSHRQMQEHLQKDKSSTPTKDRLLSLSKKKGSVTKTRVIGRKTKRSSSTTMF